MPLLLQGRCITVVGAGTQPSRDPDAPIGNGRAIAVRAAREGASVVCVDRDEAAVEETWRMITEEGGRAAIVIADVTTEEGCRTALSDDPGRAPDGLVLNVGTGFGMGVAGTSLDEWDRTFALNLRSHFLLVRRALVTLRDDASILFMGSVAGLRPGSRIPAYDASKAGLIGLSRHVAVEGARRGIRANVLAPGLIDTPLGRAASAGRPSRHVYTGAARPPGHRLGGGGGGGLLALRRGQLHHGAGPRGGRGIDARMSAHSAHRASAPHQRPPTPLLGRRMARFNRSVVNKISIHLAGFLPGMGIVFHVGRRTRQVYGTPVLVFRTKDGFRIALTYGRDSDWVKNALAHGAVRLVTRRKEYELTEPELVTDLHRQHVPLLLRGILRLLRVAEFLDFQRVGAPR